jgi:hypothetical protein
VRCVQARVRVCMRAGAGAVRAGAVRVRCVACGACKLACACACVRVRVVWKGRDSAGVGTVRVPACLPWQVQLLCV